MNFGWLTGFMTPTAREHVLEHSGQADSARERSPSGFLARFDLTARMLTADADDPGRSRNCSRSAACLRRSIRQPWPVLDGQNPAKAGSSVPVVSPDQAVNPGNLRSLPASLASRPESGKSAGAGAFIAVRPAACQVTVAGLRERGPLRRSCPAGSVRSGSSGVQFAHDCGSSTGFTPVCPSREPSPSVRARQLLRKLHRNRRGAGQRPGQALHGEPLTCEKNLTRLRWVWGRLIALAPISGSRQSATSAMSRWTEATGALRRHVLCRGVGCLRSLRCGM